MATMRADRDDAAFRRARRETISEHAAHARQEFRAGLMAATVFLVGLALIISLGLPG
jgi:hypothetical protein